MENILTFLQEYWLQFLSAVVAGLAGVFHKWLIKKIKDFFKWCKSVCPGFGIIRRLEAIQEELKPNHGNSIKDAINRIERKITDNYQKINILVAGLDILSDTLNVCRWAADKNGKINFVNKPLRELIGSTDDHAWSLGDAWTNSVFKDDRETAIGEWERCVRSKIEYHDTFRIVNIITGKVLLVTSYAKIIKNTDGQVEGWAGVVTPVENKS